MSLNIKNERVCTLARTASRLTGQPQTSVIEEALLAFLRAHGVDPDGGPLDEDVRASEARVDALLDELRTRLDRGNSAEILTVEDLYDPVTGLPA